MPTALVKSGALPFDREEDVGNGASLPRESLSVQAYHVVRRDLMNGTFVPGQKLLLREVAARLGISITPVREALLQLVAEQALIADSSRTLVVPTLTPNRFKEVLELRLDLEGRAAGYATLNITEKGVIALEEIHNALAASKANGDFGKVMLHNERFHFELYRHADRPALYRIIESLWVQAGPYMRRLCSLPPLVERHEHLNVLRGLRCGDAQLATEALRKDILLSGRIILEQLSEEDSLPRGR